MKSTSGALLPGSVSSSFRADARAAIVEVLRLLALGAVAVAIHAATRNRLELGPGHQGLTWMAMVMIARLTSPQRWAGLTAAAGAAGATMLPIWRFGDPFLWVSYAAAGTIVDLGCGGLLRSRRALWAVALIGGLAHAAKPLIRTVIQFGGWRYESLLAGLPFPFMSHFFFGAAGALIGATLVLAGRKVARERTTTDS